MNPSQENRPSRERLRWPFIPGRDLRIERTEGIYLYTAEGQQLIDAAGGAIVANIGHGVKRVADAVAEATLTTSYVVPPWLTPSRVAMLEALAHWLPPAFTRVHCTSGGTEAVEAAMKIALHLQQARGHTHKTQIIGRSVSYHGTTFAAASISGHPARKKGLEGALPAFPSAPTPYPLRCPLGPHHPDTGAYYADALEETILAVGPDNVAAVLAEPITGSSGGALVPPDDYWPRVRELCDQYEIALVLDEVMTGFGRTGVPFAFQHWDIEPDIFVAGKGLAGGYAPLGGVFGTEAVGAAIENAGFPVMFNTFGAHPAACAAAAEVLTIMREDELVTTAAARGAYLHKRLEQTFSNHPHVAEIRGRGLLQALELVADRDTLEPFPEAAQLANRLVARALQNGAFFYGGGTGEVRDIVCLGPAFIISEAQIDNMVDILARSLDEVLAQLSEHTTA